MLFSDAYIQSLKSCLDVKIALAGHGSYLATALKFRRDINKYYLRCMVLYKRVLDAWDNRPGATNSITEEQFAAIVAEIEKMPFGCSPGLLQTVISLDKVDVNLGPVVNAGMDISTGATSVVLSGTAYDPEGLPVDVVWTKLIGGSVTITNATTLTPTLTGLSEGSYVFQLGARDNKGVWSFDTVIVTCIAATLDTIYYGGVDTNGHYDVVENSVFKVPYNTLFADSTQNVTINWLGAYAGYKYPWVLIPARTIDSIKSVVQATTLTSTLNMEIESYVSPGVFSTSNPGNLFKRLLYDHPEEPTRNYIINGTPYVLYLATWQTILNSSYIFKKQ